MSSRPEPAPPSPQLDPVDGLAQLAFVVMGLLERRAAEHDLSIPATRLLGVLRDREPTMNELARILGLDKSSVTGLVERAERRGLVERAPSPADRRAVLVRLTAAGQTLVSAAAGCSPRTSPPCSASCRPGTARRFPGWSAGSSWPTRPARGSTCSRRPDGAAAPARTRTKSGQ